MIESTLNKLCQEVGVKGTMMLTRDGIVVQSALPAEELSSDKVAAVAADAILRTIRALEQAGRGGFERFVLEASFGKMIFVDVERAFLVVLAERGIDLQMTQIAIQHAAYKLRGG